MPISTAKTGFIYGAAAYLIWGFFPLYFHYLRQVPAMDVLMHRIIWSNIIVTLILVVLRRYHQIKTALQSRQNLQHLLLSSLFISTNWLIFIWAVAQGRVVESSLGYFITPLVSVFLGRFFLDEQLNRWQSAAILLASLGLLWLIVRLGYLPWISFLLAITFGGYGLVRKQMAVDSLTGFSIETLLLLPFAIGYALIMFIMDQNHFFVPNEPVINALLLLSGLVTAAPLLLFASAAKKLRLSVIGFMMYINPSMQFITAIWLLDEPFSVDQFIGFCCIWCALLIFTFGSVYRPVSR